MINAPLHERIEISLKKPELRAINREYYTELTAKSSAAIAMLQVEQMRMQAKASASTLRAMSEIEGQQRVSNEMLGTISDGIGGLLQQSEIMVEQLVSLENTLQQGVADICATLNSGFSMVARAIERAISVLEEQQRTLSHISVLLSTPYETRAQELLREGEKWLKVGAESMGIEQEENWKDALRLFKSVLENDIGRQNYVAWFNVGYLQWKLLQDIPEAEKSFFNAQRYSAPNRDIWHTKSLRHMGEMQYLQQKFSDAYATAHRAMAVKREYETLFNVARYASRIGHRDEMSQLLDECIELRPETIITMFAEDDFKP